MILKTSPLAAALMAALLTQTAAADTGRRDYHIPAQALNQALLAFGQQSGQPLLYDTALTEHLQSRALIGRYGTDAALATLLADAPLQAVATDAGSLTLQPKARAMTVANNDRRASTTLPKVTVVGSAEYDGEDPRNTDYNRPNAVTATKTDTPIMDTPVSIQVVPQQVLKDQQAWRLEDAVKNVSGVQQIWASGGQYQDFIVRGFGTNYSRFRNGVRLPDGTFDMANTESVEVLKGPAAMLYGRVEPGGMINVVTKKPLARPYYALQQQFGSYDFYRTNADATGPINDSLAYRINLGFTDHHSFRDFIGEDRVTVAPSLHWQATPDTEVNLSLEYSDNDTAYDNGIPAIGQRVANVPINRNYTQPELNRDNIENTLVDFNWTHSVNDAWKVSNGIVASMSNYAFRQTPVAYFQPLLEDTDNPQVRRGLYFEDFSRDNYTTYLNLNGKFDTLGIHHNVLLGGDYYDFKYQGSGFFGLNYAIQQNFDGDALKYFTFVDLYRPDYRAFPYSYTELDALRKNAANDFNRSSQSWYGVYFQDQLSFFDGKLHILGGGRYDWARQSQGFAFTSFADISETARHDQHFSPRVGILYRPWQWLSVYGNYVESLGLNNSLSRGAPLPPELAEQFEAGLKTEWFDGLLTTNLAYFHLTKTNIAQQTGDTTFDTIGEARSQGIEFDMSGQLNESLSLIVSYAFTDARITKDLGLIYDDTGSFVIGAHAGNQGKRLPNVGEHSGSAWLKYAFQTGKLRGLSFGVGAFLAGSREGDNENSYQLPGYVRADSYAAYSFPIGTSKLTAQLNVNNVFDHRYYFTGLPYNTAKAYTLIADPLTLLGSVKLEF